LALFILLPLSIGGRLIGSLGPEVRHARLVPLSLRGVSEEPPVLEKEHTVIMGLSTAVFLKTGRLFQLGC
jgi:hypothetical protein